MPLVQLSDLTTGFRGPPLLDDVSCQIEAGDRIGLLGRNGSGKTTLMRILAGELTPDHGRITFAPGTKVSILPQEVPQNLAGTVHDVIQRGMAPELADHQDWEAERKLELLIGEMQLDANSQVESLSAGMKRRVLLAQQLVLQPDLLLLDEPTNHLDIDAISGSKFSCPAGTGRIYLSPMIGLSCVGWQREFLRSIAAKSSIGRAITRHFSFAKKRPSQLRKSKMRLFDKKLAQEEAWIRQGIKARRTRNEGRVRALKELRVQRAERRKNLGKAKISIQAEQRSGAVGHSR